MYHGRDETKLIYRKNEPCKGTVLSLAGNDNEFAEWDDFVIAHPRGHYFQLYGFLSSYAPMGFDAQVLLLRRNGQITAGAAFVSFKLPGLKRRIFLLPHGPICDQPGGSDWNCIMSGLDEQFRNQGVIYAQVWPSVASDDKSGLDPFFSIGYQSKRLFNAHEFSSTLLAVDITADEDELMATFRQKTRTACRKSRSTGLRLHLGTTGDDLARSYEVWQENGSYHGYAVRPLSSFKIILERLIIPKKALLIQAWKGDILAGSILILFAGRFAIYAQGGMRREFGPCCPGEFMHMEAMRAARERGLVGYDLNCWGTEGTRLFKSGFHPVECSWADPMVKVYRPAMSWLVAKTQFHFRPLLRTMARWRANLHN